MAEKIENNCEWRVACKISVSDSRLGMFPAVAGIFGAELVSKHEKGLETGQRLPRKVCNTTTHGGQVQWCSSHLFSQFSRQPLTAFEPGFDFPDRFNTQNHYKGRKRFAARIRDGNFERVSPRLCMHESFVFTIFELEVPTIFELCFVILNQNRSLQVECSWRLAISNVLPRDSGPPDLN